jgi:hypothetical protein
MITEEAVNVISSVYTVANTDVKVPSVQQW